MRLSEAGEISISGYAAGALAPGRHQCRRTPTLRKRFRPQLDLARWRGWKDVVEQHHRLAVRSLHLQRVFGGDPARPDAAQTRIRRIDRIIHQFWSEALKHGSSNPKRAARRRKISVLGNDSPPAESPPPPAAASDGRTTDRDQRIRSGSPPAEPRRNTSCSRSSSGRYRRRRHRRAPGRGASGSDRGAQRSDCDCR